MAISCVSQYQNLESKYYNAILARYTVLYIDMNGRARVWPFMKTENIISVKFIGPSHTEWAGPLEWEPEEEGSSRQFIDYSRLYNFTVQGSYLIPCVNERIRYLKEETIVPSLDARIVYLQRERANEDLNNVPPMVYAVSHVCEDAIWSTKRPRVFSKCHGCNNVTCEKKVPVALFRNHIGLPLEPKQHVAPLIIVFRFIEHAKLTLVLEN